MNIPQRFSVLVIVGISLLLTGFAVVFSYHYHKKIPLTNEEELKVTVDAGFGKLFVARGEPRVLLEANVDTDNETDLTEYIEYDIRDRIGYLSLSTDEEEVHSHKKKKKYSFDIKSSSWTMQFTDAVPISFDIELGLGKGDLDLTGLNVKDLNLSAGASSVLLKFDQPNKSVIEELTIASGLSRFRAEGLCNANFNRLRFEGGVGDYSLDFGGSLKREVDVDIEVGLGSLTITIPKQIGTRVMYNKSFISHITLDRDFSEEEEDNYYSSNYYSSKGRINMHIEAGLGSVKIKRK
ncbi:MAG: hypothetical protein HY707_00130 [Ignavibacteriae bacterium]|nr:hypothetical protein [Ignavibacteriota bacterium]